MRSSKNRKTSHRSYLPSIAQNKDFDFERAKNIATIFSAIAIPIVLTIAGYFIQRQIADDGLKKDYVGIAASILKENSKTQEPDTRKWAVEVLETYSPIPFSPKAKESLLVGQPIIVPGPALHSPPEICRKSPAKRTVLRAVNKLSKDIVGLSQEEINQHLITFINNIVIKQEKDALKTQIDLECMQHWANVVEQVDDEYRKSIGAPSSKSVYEALEKEKTASAKLSSSDNIAEMRASK